MPDDDFVSEGVAQDVQNVIQFRVRLQLLLEVVDAGTLYVVITADYSWVQCYQVYFIFYQYTSYFFKRVHCAFYQFTKEIVYMLSGHLV